MTTSEIAVIMTSISAVAAIVAPVVTTIYTTKSQERMRKAEMYLPRVYDALVEMAQTYSQMIRENTVGEDLESQKETCEQAMCAYYEFVGTCYKVMSLIPNEKIQKKFSQLLTEIKQSGYSPFALHDKMMCQLIADINDFLQHSNRKKPKKNA